MMKPPSADEIFAILSSAVHAPTYTHGPFDGSCSECPWPMYQLPPEELATELASWLNSHTEEES